MSVFSDFIRNATIQEKEKVYNRIMEKVAEEQGRIMSYKTIPVSYSLYKEGDNPIFGNSAIRVSVDDEAGGPFLRISQCNDDHSGEILLNFDEIEPLFEVLNEVRREWTEIDAEYGGE